MVEILLDFSAIEGIIRADRKKGNMTLTVWTGWTTSWAALPAAAAESRIFCSSHKLQIQKAYSWLYKR